MAGAWISRRTSCRRAALLLLIGLAFLLLPSMIRAGEPKYVAGPSFFNSGVMGKAVAWANGTVAYYTDQGNLSPLLNGSAADAFVADAFSRWTSVPTTALSANRAGQLSEDVSGANVVHNSDGSITMPVDIQPAATDHPVGVVYDYDGQVINALLGLGSGNRDSCFSNAVAGGPDAFAPDGTITHALVVINGNCLQASSDLLESKYRLVRMLGAVLGLDWSQLNLNVLTGSPRAPTANDKAGFPLMHGVDPRDCTPITLCYPDPDQLKMDDRAAIARLYPVTSENLAQFPGKQVFSTATARIHGSVYFTDAAGNPAQPMQCVNVVARWIDPDTVQASGRYAASSVSGFRFAGNAGNPVTGYVDPLGSRYDRFGSTDQNVEGAFDLAGLELPQGGPAQYQLSVEPLDPNLSLPVGPCAQLQVAPSGAFAPVVVTLNAGDDVVQDVLMAGSAPEKDDPNRDETYNAPLPIPRGGAWSGALSGYGDADYFWFSARANRTLSIDVTALDENDQPTQFKARPLIGLWYAGSPAGSSPAVATPMPFNTSISALTQLNVQVLNPVMLRLGLADLRGNGRPDFHYRAQLLYGDAVTPSHVSVRGGDPFTITGVGFKPGITVSVGNSLATILALSDTQIVAAAPFYADGTQSITIRNPATGATSTLQGALVYGASPTDTITVTNTNPATPVGGQTPFPIQATVLSIEGQPVSGAKVQWSVNNSAVLSLCGGSACSAISDDKGHAETRVTLKAQGVTTVSATLFPGQGTQTTLTARADSRSISLSPMRLYATEAMTLDVPVTARVLTNTGAAVSGLKLDFIVTAGTGTPNPASATTDTNGYARSTLHVDSLSGEVDVTVCASSGGIPCTVFSLLTVAASALQLQPVSGSGQIVRLGQSFTPLWVRVLDSSSPPNPVYGAAVSFDTELYRLDGAPAIVTGGDDNSSSHPSQKVKLGSSQAVMISDADGYAGISVPHGDGTRALEVDVAVTAGARAVLTYQLWEVWPPDSGSASKADTTASPSPVSPRAPRPR
jgi:hypothetical protein